MCKGPTWEDISGLANRFDCLSMGGGLSRVLDIADRMRVVFACTGRLDAPLADAQISLSFECRSMQHCGVVPQPGGDDWTYLSALYERVKAGDAS